MSRSWPVSVGNWPATALKDPHWRPGLEPKRGGQPALRQVQNLEAAQQIIHAVESDRRAIHAVNPAGRASLVQAEDAGRLIGVVAEQDRLRQVIERQVQQRFLGGSRPWPHRRRHTRRWRPRRAHPDRAGDHRAVGELFVSLVRQQFDGRRRHVNDERDLGHHCVAVGQRGVARRDGQRVGAGGLGSALKALSSKA